MIKGKKILLRAIEPADIDKIYEWENDPSVWHLSDTHKPWSKELLMRYILSANDIFTDKQLRLMIETTGSRESIGCIDLFDYHPLHQRAGIGIIIGEHKARRNGYASESLDLLIDYGFNTLGLHQLYCNIIDDNKASMALFESRGFKRSGVKKDWNRASGKWVDEYFYQLIKHPQH